MLSSGGKAALNSKNADAAEDAGQAAGLCKADLATSMVMEMTALAGTMGRHYALSQGVKPQVAEVRRGSSPPHPLDIILLSRRKGDSTLSPYDASRPTLFLSESSAPPYAERLGSKLHSMDLKNAVGRPFLRACSQGKRVRGWPARLLASCAPWQTSWTVW